MFLALDPSDSRPVFRQIVDEVQQSIATGILKPHDPLPAARQLAAELKVNTNTVQHAYKVLEAEASVYVRRGLGTFVAARPALSPARQSVVARQIAEKMLREAYRHGVLASELLTALQSLVPR